MRSKIPPHVFVTVGILAASGVMSCHSGGSPGGSAPSATTQPDAGGTPDPANAGRPGGRPWYTTVEARLNPEYRRQRDLGEPERPLPADATREVAHAFLLTTNVFAGPAVGVGGETSSQARAFGHLLDDPLAAGAFEDLVLRGDIAGQLYGLCGLYLKNRARFAALAEPLLHDGRTVSVQFGCVMRSWPIDALIPLIVDGSYPRMFEQEARGATTLVARRPE